MKISNRTAREKRVLRVRSKLQGTALRPRLSVYRSNNNLQAQLIDDEKGVTLFGISTTTLKTSGTRLVQAAALGTALAKAALDKKIETVLFDRGANRYHGRVKAVAEAARAGGLKF